MTQVKKSAEDIKIQELINTPDITHIENKDPKFKYRWVRDDPIRIKMMQREGWELCDGMTSGNEKPDPTFAKNTSATSQIPGIPELVAMRRPKALHEKVVAAKKERHEAFVKREEEQAIESVNKALEQVGIRGRMRRQVDAVMKD